MLPKTLLPPGCDWFIAGGFAACPSLASTHQVGVMSDGRVLKGSRWTPPHLKPRKLKHTPTTNDRMIKIGERFGHVMEYAVNQGVGV